MLIDCDTCPARYRECDGCMMQLVLTPVTSEYVTSRDHDAMCDAVAVFVATELISDEEADAAIDRIYAGEGDFGTEGHRLLRVV